MKKVFWIVLFCCSCTARQPFIIQPYSGPKIIVKNVGKEIGVDMKNLEDLGIENEPETNKLFYPDPLKGYIENRAFPFTPKVWVIANGKKIILIGPKEGPPEFLNGEIREFRFDPGIYVLHVEKWIKISHEWKKVGKEKVVKLSVAQTEQQLGSIDHYGWWIVINQTSVEIH